MAYQIPVICSSGWLSIISIILLNTLFLSLILFFILNMPCEAIKAITVDRKLLFLTHLFLMQARCHNKK